MIIALKKMQIIHNQLRETTGDILTLTWASSKQENRSPLELNPQELQLMRTDDNESNGVGTSLDMQEITCILHYKIANIRS